MMPVSSVKISAQRAVAEEAEECAAGDEQTSDDQWGVRRMLGRSLLGD
jgi:hypothetical protein